MACKFGAKVGRETGETPHTMAARRRPPAPHQPEMGQAGHDDHHGGLAGGHGSDGRHGNGAAAKASDTAARTPPGRFGTTAALLAWLALVVVRACRPRPWHPAECLRAPSLSPDAHAACATALRAWPL